MLTSAESIVRYDFQRRTVIPDRLTRRTHRHYVQAAERMLAVYREGCGETRQTLHLRIEAILDRLGDCPPRRTAAFCKLLDDRGEFRKSGREAARLRQRVFTRAAEFHPLVTTPDTMLEQTPDRVRQQIAEEVGRPWEEIASALFADVIELQTLTCLRSGAELTAVDLLSAYNVAQTQAALYRATQVSVWATDDFKTILRHAKLAGLMHRITRLGEPSSRPTYQFHFDGPASAVRQTWRYGIRYARMLPKLLACRGWKLRAEVLGPGPDGRRAGRYELRLSPADGLQSPHEPSDEYDSKFEREIFECWQRSPPEDWELTRESEILFRGQTVFTPDFVLRRKSAPNRPIYVEVLGYWTPEYLRDKSERLARFSDCRWIVIAPSNHEHHVPVGVPLVIWDKNFDPQSLVSIVD